MLATLNRSTVAPNFRALVDSQSTTVKRCLFGEPDHSQIRPDLKKQLSDIAMRDSEKWNFDFCAFMPLVGRYDWEPIPITSGGLASTAEPMKKSNSSMKDNNVSIVCMELRSGRQCNKKLNDNSQSSIIGR